jgi:hypothetical protein
MAHQRPDSPALLGDFLVNERFMLTGVQSHGITALPLLPFLVDAKVRYQANVEGVQQHIAHAVLAETARTATPVAPFGAELDLCAVGQRVNVFVEPSGDVAVRVLTGGVPLESQADGLSLDGMWHQRERRGIVLDVGGQ